MRRRDLDVERVGRLGEAVGVLGKLVQGRHRAVLPDLCRLLGLRGRLHLVLKHAHVVLHLCNTPPPLALLTPQPRELLPLPLRGIGGG